MPESWRHAGTENGNGRYFQNNYRMLYISGAILILAIIAQGHL